jgi:hypothetical protein
MNTRTERPRTSALLVTLGAGVLGLAGVVGTRQLGVHSRLRQLEGEVSRVPIQSQAQLRALEELHLEIAVLREELNRASSGESAAQSLAERLAGAESRLSDIAGAIDAQGTSLKVLTEASSTLAPTLEERMAVQAERMGGLIEELRSRLETAESKVDSSGLQLDQLLQADQRDVARMWVDLVGPTVQLAGENSVGSGVLLASIELPGNELQETTYVTYLLTAWHVVRDILEGDLEMPVPVITYPEDGSTRQYKAVLLRHDPTLDAALLELDAREPFEFGAILPPRSRLGDVRIFDPIYAVGCPLGNDPIPTPGEIATCHHRVEELNYWMINAPTYIGNSGGGIFDAHSHELLGIFSKIYTHGSLRPTIVPHMGLVTPLASIYDWLEAVGFGQLVPKE